MTCSELPRQFVEDSHCYLEGVIPPHEMTGVRERAVEDVHKLSPFALELVTALYIGFSMVNRERQWPFTRGGARGLAIPAKRHRPHSGALRGRSAAHSGHVDVAGLHGGERQLTGRAGTVALFDMRLWHAVAPNLTKEDRVAVIVRYAPWWLNLNPLRPGTPERTAIVEANNGLEAAVTPLPRRVYEALPPASQALVHHNVETV